jgi:hypothetical protein
LILVQDHCLVQSGGFQGQGGGSPRWVSKRGFPVMLSGLWKLHADAGFGLGVGVSTGVRAVPARRRAGYDGSPPMLSRKAIKPLPMKSKHSKSTIFGPCTLGRTWGTRPGGWVLWCPEGSPIRDVRAASSVRLRLRSRNGKALHSTVNPRKSRNSVFNISKNRPTCFILSVSLRSQTRVSLTKHQNAQRARKMDLPGTA